MVVRVFGQRKKKKKKNKTMLQQHLVRLLLVEVKKIKHSSVAFQGNFLLVLASGEVSWV